MIAILRMRVLVISHVCIVTQRNNEFHEDNNHCINLDLHVDNPNNMKSISFGITNNLKIVI